MSALLPLVRRLSAYRWCVSGRDGRTPRRGAARDLDRIWRFALCLSCSPTTTDSAGAFYFPGTEGHDAVIILAPIDREYSYTFCARVADIMRFVFEESIVVREFGTTPDSLTCIESRTPNMAPVVCTKQP